ncbi:MAG: type II secretion system protein GspN [Nitrospirota bacterium]
MTAIPQRSGRRISWGALAAYAFYTLVVFLVFLVWQFPVEALQVRLLAELERRAAATVTVQERNWLFPLGVSWRGIRLAPRERPDRTIDLDALRVRVALLPLVSRRVDADVAWEAYGGTARGNVVVRREANGMRSEVDQFGRGFDLTKIPGFPSGSWRGSVQFELNTRWLNDAWWLGEGTGSVELSGLKVDGITVSGFPVNGIEFDTVTGQVALKGGTLTLQRLAGRGPLGTVSGDGTVLVRAPWTESVINMTLRVEPSAEARSRIPVLALTGDKADAITVRVSGRMVRPDVTVNGIPVV